MMHGLPHAAGLQAAIMPMAVHGDSRHSTTHTSSSHLNTILLDGTLTITSWWCSAVVLCSLMRTGAYIAGAAAILTTRSFVCRCRLPRARARCSRRSNASSAVLRPRHARERPAESLHHAWERGVKVAACSAMNKKYLRAPDGLNCYTVSVTTNEASAP